MTNASKVSYVSGFQVLALTAVLAVGAFAGIALPVAAHADDYYSEPFDGGGSYYSEPFDNSYYSEPFDNSYYSEPFDNSYYSEPFDSSYYTEPSNNSYYTEPLYNDYTDNGTYCGGSCDGYTEEGGVLYSEEGGYNSSSYGSSNYGSSSYGGSSYPMSYPQQTSFAAPRSYYQNPVSYPAPQQQQQQQQQNVYPTSNNTSSAYYNTCTATNSCNTTVTRIDNSDHSINNSGNTVTTISSPTTITIDHSINNSGNTTNSNNTTTTNSGNTTISNIIPPQQNAVAAAPISITNTNTNINTTPISQPQQPVYIPYTQPTYYNYQQPLTYVQPQVYRPVVTPTYTYPTVSLSQIPYTGFDFGPVGNALYWLSLLSFALAAAYLLVYYRGGAALFAPRAMTSVAYAPAKAVEATAKKIDAVIAPVLSPFQNVKAGDTMIVHASKNGEAPRIVINRA